MSVVLLVLMQLITTVPYLIYRARGTNDAALRQTLTADKTLILLSIISTIPAHLLTIGLVWAVVTNFGKRPFWRTLGWSWNRNFGFWTSASLAVALLIFGGLLTKLLGGVETQIDQIVASSIAARYAIAFLATATAPLVEELIYRGVLYSALQRVAGAGLAVAGVLALFTVVHVPQYWPNVGVISAVGVLSLALTLVRAYTGRLLPCFIMHLVFNGLQSIFIVLEPYLPQLSTSGEQKAAIILTLARALQAV